ncbi:unnamed protein product [Psylliodes chrysocephalus]|uniref:Uncharacterized protein n=1 Tax=Psylliodes chrysocephalus TaxID=3402493 RepID=A0A9P0D5B5_9CUCU|nr:unnamed protein product [Psylliodes chrysocephala]
MDAFFKCCKNKELNNYFCTVRFNVFQRSSIERKKYFKELGDSKIYCSEKCENEHVNDKDIHIERLNKKTQDFEDEAMEMEKKKDYQKIKEQSDTIKMLNKEIIETQVRMLSHETKLMNKNNKIKCLEQELKDLDSVGRNMVNAIRILEEENNQY